MMNLAPTTPRMPVVVSAARTTGSLRLKFMNVTTSSTRKPSAPRPVRTEVIDGAQCRSTKPDSWVGLDIEVSVVGADRHDEVMQEALEPGQPEWVGPWVAEPDRRVPGELIGAIVHREVDAG